MQTEVDIWQLSISVYQFAEFDFLYSVSVCFRDGSIYLVLLRLCVTFCLDLL